MKWFLKVWRNYINFDGRARRKEFWMFTLFQLIIFIVLSSLFVFPFLGQDIEPITASTPLYVFYLYCCAVFLPSLAVTIRRLHDLGKTGWIYFIVFVPVAGIITMLVLLVTEGNRGPNAYGPDPKGEEVAEWV